MSELPDFSTYVLAALKDRGLSKRAAARALNYDAGYLSRVLNGKQRPSPRVAEALDRLVGAGGELVKLAEAVSPDDRSRVAHSTEHPSRVDTGTVRAFADVLTAQRRLEDAVGPRAVLPGALGHLGTLTTLAREARGPHRRPMLAVAAEWTQFTGWLHAAVREDERAVQLLSQAEEMADEAGEPTVAAVAVSFKGYVARQRGRYPGVVRAAFTSLHTPGVHHTQRTFDTLQAAQGHAAMDERGETLRLLDEAERLLNREVEPPPALYWYRPAFFRMNIGMVHLALDRRSDAAACLTEGLSGLPPEQQSAEWTNEYRRARDIAAGEG